MRELRPGPSWAEALPGRAPAPPPLPGRGPQRRGGGSGLSPPLLLGLPGSSPGPHPAAGLRGKEGGGRLALARPWAATFPPGRNELTSARPGNAAGAGGPKAPARLARLGSGRERGGKGRRADQAVWPPGWPAESSVLARGRRGPGYAPEGVPKDLPGGSPVLAGSERPYFCRDRASPLPATTHPESLPPSLRCSPSLQSSHFLQRPLRFLTIAASSKLLPNPVDF